MADSATPKTLAEALLLLEQEAEVSALLQGRIASLIREFEQAKATIESLLRRLFGRSSEKCDPNQLWLDALVVETDAQPVELLEDHRDKPRGKRIRESRL